MSWLLSVETPNTVGGANLRHDGGETRIHDRRPAVLREDHGLEGPGLCPWPVAHQARIANVTAPP